MCDSRKTDVVFVKTPTQKPDIIAVKTSTVLRDSSSKISNLTLCSTNPNLGEGLFPTGQKRYVGLHLHETGYGTDQNGHRKLDITATKKLPKFRSRMMY